MPDYPKRQGYRLNEEGENLYGNWLDTRSCSCHTGCAPCSTCTHEGHPISLGESDEVWEIDEEQWEIIPMYNQFQIKDFIHRGWTVEQMIQQNILKLKQEEIMSRTEIKDKGSGSKTFKEGYWYKCVDPSGATRLGKYYKLLYKKSGDTGDTGGFENGEGTGIGNYYYKRFDLNSESSYNPEGVPATGKAGQVYDKERGWTDPQKVQLEGYVVPKEVNLAFNLNQQEETNMSNISRRIVNIEVLDQDSALDVEDSVVTIKEKVVTQDSDEVTIREWLSTGELKEALEAHNKKRTDKVNRDILTRTGNKVYLEAIKVKDLTIRVV